MMNLSLQTALGAMRIIARGSVDLAMAKLGVTDTDVLLVTDDLPWTSDDRPKVRRTMDAYIYGVIEMLGLPRFELPAEYIAAVISTFVAPVNYFPACVWVTGGVAQEELVSGMRGTVPEGFEQVKPATLFALVLQLESQADLTAASYMAKTGAQIARLVSPATPPAA